jgi:hypothetical protein
MALFCVMSFCEVENKHECLRTVQGLRKITVQGLRKITDQQAFNFPPEVIEIISYR